MWPNSELELARQLTENQEVVIYLRFVELSTILSAISQPGQWERILKLSCKHARIEGCSVLTST